jgi:hypothetical protein
MMVFVSFLGWYFIPSLICSSQFPMHTFQKELNQTQPFAVRNIYSGYVFNIHYFLPEKFLNSTQEVENWKKLYPDGYIVSYGKIPENKQGLVKMVQIPGKTPLNTGHAYGQEDQNAFMVWKSKYYQDHWTHQGWIG